MGLPSGTHMGEQLHYSKPVCYGPLQPGGVGPAKLTKQLQAMRGNGVLLKPTRQLLKHVLISPGCNRAILGAKAQKDELERGDSSVFMSRSVCTQGSYSA